MSRRLLLALAGGDGGFPARPEIGRWQRQGAVLTAPSWASPGILEPTVRYEGAGDWRMWFRGGGLHGEGTGGEQIGYATSTDGIAWTDSGAAILGGGVGGEAHPTICPHMRTFGTSTFYLYYTDIVSHQVSCATSTTGISGFTIAGNIGLSLPSGTDEFGHTEVWKEGSTYYALVDAHNTTPSYWPTFLATSSSPTSGWSWLNSGNQLSTMRPATNGTYGAAYVRPESPTMSGLYECWYHASPVAGNLVSDLYRAYSSDRVNWTQYGPILQRTGTGYEIDQVADPCLLEVAGTSYMYYDADEAATGICAIKLATIETSLANVVAGT